MKKSLIALAALAAATGASAQSSVTISGFLNGSFDMFSISNAHSTRLGNKSENRVSDNSSRIIFNMTEGLGSGLTAVGQFDLRFALDASQRYSPDDNATITDGKLAARNPATNAVTSGNNHVGLVSKEYGALRLGRQDIHYTEGASFNHPSASTIVSSINILHSVGSTPVGIANWSRTPNLIWYSSPNFNGFSGNLGYSTNGTRTSGGFMEQENEMASTRRGSATWLKLAYDKGPLNVAFSEFKSKSDWVNAGPAATQSYAAVSVNAFGQNMSDREGRIITGKFAINSNFSVGAAYAQNLSRGTATTDFGVETKQNATQLGLGYKSGPHNVAFTHTRKDNAKVGGVEKASTGVSQNSLVYAYELSRRTAVTIGYVVMSNDTSAANTLFYNGENAVGSYGSGALAGEKHSATAIGMRHSF